MYFWRDVRFVHPCTHWLVHFDHQRYVYSPRPTFSEAWQIVFRSRRNIFSSCQQANKIFHNFSTTFCLQILPAYINIKHIQNRHRFFRAVSRHRQWTRKVNHITPSSANILTKQAIFIARIRVNKILIFTWIYNTCTEAVVYCVPWALSSSHHSLALASSKPRT